MKKLTIKEAAKKVVEDHEIVEALVQKLNDKKASPRIEVSVMGSELVTEKGVDDNLALLTKTLEIYGGIVTGSSAQLKTETDGEIYEALKEEINAI